MSEDQDGRQELLPVSKYHQRDYFRNKSQCHQHHNKTICNKRVCRNLRCRWRHPRTRPHYARNGECKWQEKCAYKHKKPESSDKTICLKMKSNSINKKVIELKIMMLADQ